MSGDGWLGSLDIYCERVDASFWSEPLNAASNVAFFIAAWCLWRRYKRNYPGPGTRQWELEALVWLIAGVGLGSFLFHTVATRWAQAADVIPIIVALLWALGVFLRRQMRFSPFKVAVGFALFLAATAAFNVVPAALVNGSQLYFSTAAALLVMGGMARHKEVPLAGRYLVAGAVFTVSLVCRSVDLALCDGLPLGTHFMWHALNGLTFYLAVSVLVD